MYTIDTIITSIKLMNPAKIHNLVFILTKFHSFVFVKPRADVIYYWVGQYYITSAVFSNILNYIIELEQKSYITIVM